MVDRESFWDAERSMLSRPVTETDIRGWEKKHGLSLPRTLAAMLVVRNGGGVAGTEMFIDPLAQIVPLNDDQLDDVCDEPDLDLSDGSKVIAFGGDEVGALLALDYSVGQEPRVLALFFDGAGGSQIVADSFDELFGGE